MRWHGFSGFKYYASAGVALVGLSAASTLLLDRVTLAQQPTRPIRKRTRSMPKRDKLEQLEKELAKLLGDNHPKLEAAREKLLEARAQEFKAKRDAFEAEVAAAKRAAEAFKVEAGAKKRVVVQNVSGNRSHWQKS